MLRLASKRYTTRISSEFVKVLGRPSYLKTKSFATTGKELEYDIDIISLTKTPKARISFTKDFKSRLIDFQSNHDLIDRAIIESTIEKVHNNSNKELNMFINDYKNELMVFLRFIKRSYSNKIRSYDELTSVELLNCLYIFRDLYRKNKIADVKVEDQVRFNEMFKRMLEFIEMSPRLPVLLNNKLFIDEHGVELLSNNLGNYIEEIRSLSKEFNFKNLNDMKQISTAIQYIVDDFNKFLINNNNLQYNKEFFKIFIQIQKYKNLESILSKSMYKNLKPIDLKKLIEIEEFRQINRLLQKSKNKDLMKEISSNEILGFLIPEDKAVLSVIEQLHNLKYSQQYSWIEPQLTSIVNHLINNCCNGNLNVYSSIEIPHFTKFIVSTNDIENFEFSMIYKYGIYHYVNELKILKAMKNDLSSKEILNAIKELNFENKVLKENFLQLHEQLGSFFRQVSWSTDGLNNLVTHKNWYDWCEENRESKIFRHMIDYSNLSNYSYSEIEISNKIAPILNDLSELSIKNEYFDLSSTSIDYLISLYKYDEHFDLTVLKQLQLQFGDVYFSNLGMLVNGYNTLFEHLIFYDLSNIKCKEGVSSFNEFSTQSLEKYFGYYSNLIENPGLLDIMEPLVLEARFKHFEDAVSHYCEELGVLIRDEGLDFDHITKPQLLSFLRRRINEISAVDRNGNSNPHSRMADHLEEFCELTDIIDKFATNDLNSCDMKYLKTIAWLSPTDDIPGEYKQVPEYFKLHEYVNEIKVLKDYIGCEFKDLTSSELMDEIEFLQSFVHNEAEDGEFPDNFNTNLQKLARNVEKLLSYNGNHTEVLDLIVKNDSEFEKFEQSKVRNVEALPDEVSGPENLINSLPKSINKIDFLDKLSLFESFYAEKYPEDPHPYEPEFYVPNLIGMVLNETDYSFEERRNFRDLMNSFIVTFETNGSFNNVSEIMTQIEDIRKFAYSKTEYIQIPDNIPIHKFSAQLSDIKSQLKRNDFESSSSYEILSTLLRYRDSQSNEESVSKLNTLYSLLNDLFRVNGNQTSVLDRINHSESHFKEFETKLNSKTDKDVVYKQVPDSFNLEEYHAELNQLRNIIGRNFKDEQAGVILEVLLTLSSDERRFNLTKRINFSKLYSNLVRLFQHNGNQTFILDNVLLSNEVFEQFESNKSLKIIKESDKYRELFKEHGENLEYLFNKTKLINYDLIDFYDLRKDEFDDKCDNLLAKVKIENNYQYVNFYYLVKKLESMVEDDQLTLPIIARLLELNRKGVEWNGQSIEDIKTEIHGFIDTITKNRDLFSPVEDVRESIEVPVEKFDINDFKDSESTFESPAEIKGKYNDPKAFKVTESSVSDEENELFERNEIFHGKEPDSEVKKLRSTYETKPFNELTIQDYLENVNEQKKLKQEELFRQKNAFEWSKNNGRLEEKDFFNPLQVEKFSNLPKKNVNYLLLTIDGKKIISNENPLENREFDDVITIFNKFPKSEMNHFIKNINKLNRNDWKLIGGINESEKYLVFIKTKSKGFLSKLITKLKSLFAIAGATFTSLILINWWLDDVDQRTVVLPSNDISPYPDANANNTMKVDETVPMVEPTEVSQPTVEKTGWFWK
ncbi:hypothetical protein CLIB1444_01S03774 [[Candida] jaroonii]|uniref:Uncharacterized protein n=1 Tax=[Candida] jaroonii TaxID=467808 RepID=A0ACA9Y079_9ASCO|nr:hypothetical protein CLIB1444_01S03774 [[Candida] jaroonii]